MDNIEIAYKSNKNEVNNAMTSLYPIVRLNGKNYVSFLAKVSATFDRSELIENGAIIGSQKDNIITVHYPIENLSTLKNASEIDHLQIAGKIKPNLDKVAFGTRTDSVWAGINLPQGYSGNDVLIGVTDWGFDYTSPMFYDTLLTSTRILAAWDQFKQTGTQPQHHNYGVEYNTPSALSTAGSDTANFYSYATHGTHVAGIAGGSGAGLDYRGMAFESQFLFTTFLFNEAAVLDAWSWMNEKANTEGKRLVINMSWGIYHMGALDGTSLMSQALDSYSNDGIVFVTSAGNNGDVNFHIAHDFNADTLKSRINFYSSATLESLWGQSLHQWGEANQDFETQLIVASGGTTILAESDWFNTLDNIQIDTFLVAQGTDTVFYNCATEHAYATNQRPTSRLRVKTPPSGYLIGFRTRATDGTVHTWNLTELSTDVGNWGMPFGTFGSNSTTGDNNYGIGTPACTETAITVGSYASEFASPTNGVILGGTLSNFSSLGPLINGQLKPDISAPGQNVASSISSFTDGNYTAIDQVDFNGRTYPFAKLSGTSMASPAAAGIVALILQANPTLSAAQVRNIVITTARTDNKTGPIPPHNNTWGWGKINAYAAVQSALNTVGISALSPSEKWHIYPNPSAGEINITGLPDGQSYQILNSQGQHILTSDRKTSNVSNLPSGLYFVRIVMNGKVEQQKFIKQ